MKSLVLPDISLQMITFLEITILETALIGTRNACIDGINIKSADTESTYFVGVYTEAISTEYA